ncbi:MAG: DEAD/DEAH box helicase [Proteobacteria bacterium]|nr:DEAD/DEAH box helicase [Pseudomonadota bacterium]
MAAALTLALSPAGHLSCRPEHEAAPLPAELHEAIAAAFDQGAGQGLLHLGGACATSALPPVWAWWRELAARYFGALCTTQAGEEAVAAAVPAPDAAALQALLLNAPPMAGAEYLSAETLLALWQGMDAALHAACAAAGQPLPEFLKTHYPAWNLVGRVHFNLAENRKDPDTPFAFLATYTTRLSAHGKAQHVPLSQALKEFSGQRRKAQLLSLLMPVQRAAADCAWIAEMVESGEIYHPLRWEVADALRFLADAPRLEAAGIVVRMPAQWRGGRPARPQVRVALGSQLAGGVGLAAMLDFQMDVSLDGEPLGPDEIRQLLDQAGGLQWIRGQWVQVDAQRLSGLLARFRQMQQDAEGGVPLAQAMRLLSGATLAEDAPDPDWSSISAGPWLAEALRGLRTPAALAAVDPGRLLKASLRPYQQEGLRWLHFLTRLGLGACLADDMGLGKTIQVLALLLVLKKAAPGAGPSLLVAPASLLANWAQEAERFAPSLRCLLAHPSALARAELQALDADALAGYDLVITSYGQLARTPALGAQRWRLAVLDEAQAIKNPAAQQTRAAKKLQAGTRIALTGTPVENRLSDLWSIFDFTHPGLLGSERVFASFARRLAESGQYAPLRQLVAPYILRRLKSDKRVIADLPDKTEVAAWCGLSAVQATHYQQAVKALEQALERSEGMERKGLVLSFLMRLKQICNHPSQWLGDGAWQPEASGKFARLREIAETVAARQEKMLVFTQFQETTAPLAAFLGGVFGREGLVLHGGTPVARRRELVKRFQEDDQVPFFVLSIKAGGSGLNLTAASHVVHFDRWWNPAVENQATDRAYRIGQHRNVLVHKFIVRGTIEERIDALIQAKQQLVQDVVEGGGEINLTEMSDAALLDLVRLDIHATGSEA